MDLNSFALNMSKIDDGRKINLGNGCYYTIRSLRSKIAQKTLERLNEPYKGWRSIPDEVQKRILVDCMVQGLLVEFVGFKLDGKDFTFDPSNKEDQARLADVLMRPEMVVLYDHIFASSTNDKAFQDEAAAEKN